MSWNYRLVKTLYEYVDGKKDYIYDLHEVYYDSDHNPQNMTANPITFGTDGVSDEEAKKELISALKMAIKDIEKHDVFMPPKEWKNE